MSSLLLDPLVQKSWTYDSPPRDTRCPTCGYASEEPLVTGCMALVMRVLEVLGKRIARVPRSRYAVLGDRPFEAAYTLWEAEDSHLEAALDGAWSHVWPLLQIYAPEVRSPIEVELALDRVVREGVAERRAITLLDVRTALLPIVLS